MAEKITTNEVKQEVTPIVTTPFYKAPPFYMIIIAIIILIIFGVVIYFSLSQGSGPGVSGTIVAIYILGILLLIIGVIWGAFY